MRTFSILSSHGIRKEYDELCLKPTKDATAKDVIRICARVKVRQNLFARYLNTGPSTAQKWETGEKGPGTIAVKLLRIAVKHRLDVLA